MSENDPYHPSKVTISIYTLWTLMVGMGILRLRIDYGIGRFDVQILLILAFVSFCTMTWFKVWEPWDRTHQAES